MAEKKPSKTELVRMEREQLSFETALARLEQIVQRLEAGDVPLEQAVEWFQEGMELSRLCGSKLEQVEQKIEMLVEDGAGGWTRRPFAVQHDEEDQEPS